MGNTHLRKPLAEVLHGVNRPRGDHGGAPLRQGVAHGALQVLGVHRARRVHAARSREANTGAPFLLVFSELVLASLSALSCPLRRALWS